MSDTPRTDEAWEHVDGGNCWINLLICSRDLEAENATLRARIAELEEFVESGIQFHDEAHGADCGCIDREAMLEALTFHFHAIRQPAAICQRRRGNE